MSGVPHIPPTEIESWARQRLVPLRAFEFDVLLAIDDAFVQYHTEKNKKGSSVSGKKPRALKDTLRSAAPDKGGKRHPRQ